MGGGGMCTNYIYLTATMDDAGLICTPENGAGGPTRGERTRQESQVIVG